MSDLEMYSLLELFFAAVAPPTAEACLLKDLELTPDSY